MAAGRRPDGFAALPLRSPRSPRAGEGEGFPAPTGLGRSPGGAPSPVGGGAGPPPWRAAGAALGCCLGACAGLSLLAAAASPRAPHGARERLLGQASVPLALPIPESLARAGVSAERSLEVCSFQRSANGGLEGHTLWLDYVAWHQETMANRAAGGAAGRIVVWHCLDDEDCAGLADELKGISFMLYFAMVSERALVIEWRRHGTDFSELLGQPSIDWRSPGTPGDSCTEVDLMGTVRWQLGEAGWRRNLLDVLGSPDPCLRVRSNANPSAFMDDLSALPGASKVMRAIQSQVEQAVDREYLVGCALNFLFSFDEAYAQLLAGPAAGGAAPQLLVSCGGVPGCAAAPARIVGVHLRFGDRVFEGDDDVSAEVVRESLMCAAELGLERLGRPAAGGDWGIFFASDSVTARRLALEGAHEVGIPVVELAEQPAHINLDRGSRQASQLWGALGDHLMLARAQGLVQCWDKERQCGFSAFGPSGFSIVAAQEQLLQVENYRLVTPRGCQQKRMVVG